MISRHGNTTVILAAVLIVALLWAPIAYAKSTGLGTILGIVGIVVAVASCLAGCFGLPAIPALTAAAIGITEAFVLSTVLTVASAVFTTFTGVTTGLCLSGSNNPAYTGCGGGGGGGGEGGSGGGTTAVSGVGAVGTCIAGYYVCGNKSCVPIGSVCCADVGVTDKYCPSGYTCQADGNCKSGGTAAAAPTATFSATYGGQSATDGGTLNVAIGSPILLSWTSTGATSCEINNGIGGVNATGTQSISCNNAGGFQAILRCTGEGGEVKKSINLNCLSIPKIKEIKPD
ncbi:MAG: hypothetical protein Q8R35_01415 [bacterium]|nr:hypothetical protein [bacterium]